MQNDFILVLDFGGGQAQAMARKLRGQNFYSEIHSGAISLESIRKKTPRGILLAGGPSQCPFDEGVLNLGIPVVDFTSAIELIKDTDGKAAGAVLQNMETGEIMIARAKTVVLATGGAGRLHYQGFPTSNHYGATADGLILAYRAGAKLLYPETLQYHPTGVAAPTQIYGALVTEKVRSLGAQLVGKDGTAFVNPLETRDVTASSIIRECKERKNGLQTTDGEGVWLDTPMIDLIHGEGTIEKRIPAMLRMFGKYGLDIRKQPILVYPTLHYQNGGVDISANAESGVKNLFVAGEAAGGIHGTNRLGSNADADACGIGYVSGIVVSTGEIPAFIPAE